MAARQIPLGTLGLWPGTTGLGNHAGQGLGRGTAATRNDSRRYGLVRPRSRLHARPGGRQASRMSPVPHIPVLGREAIVHLAPREGGVYVDATFGAGGYSRAILEVPGTRLIAIDRDRTAIAAGAELVERSTGRLTLVEDRFSNLAEVCASQGVEAIDGVVMDVGVSSMQLDQAGRGFSFRLDGPLDMRMGQTGPTAADVVARASEGDLADIIYLLGEERHSRRIARAIVADRQETPFTTTRALADLVGRVVRSKPGDIHPATRTFQALRIFVNEELEELETALAAAERMLKPGGRLVVVSFHSLEDRIVKNFLAERSRTGGGSRHLPEVAQVTPSFRVLTRRPVVAGEDEVAGNPRARSAKLRAAERTPAPAHETDEASPWPKLSDVMRGG
ncbi:16S rRNA (cytosine(1402)-N(4))-methyltransferase RsmH [Bradyrhizobium sp. RP6]|nr:16S rRNA (cytosine(1402)-N(4))-methyltransferase RsmH [Bradyrhizobium sp. RP6]